MSSGITRDKKYCRLPDSPYLTHSILFGYLIPLLRDPEGWLKEEEEARERVVGNKKYNPKTSFLFEGDTVTISNQ